MLNTNRTKIFSWYLNNIYDEFGENYMEVDEETLNIKILCLSVN